MLSVREKNRLRQDCELIKACVKRIEKLLVGKKAKLNTIRAGSYNGREGEITSVMADSDHGITALVMIFKENYKKNDNFPHLNSRALTRQYWPLDQIIIELEE